MYRRLIPFLCLLLWASPYLRGQESLDSDTAEYEVQRQKVNELLQQRSARFGQYEQSLQQRTGIFGLKTKRDMQASIDILKEIVLTDNHIFKETKRLVDFKDFEKEMVTQQAEEFDSRINGYIATISKLQKEQIALQEQIDTLQYQRRNSIAISVFVLIALAIGFVLWYVYVVRLKSTKKKDLPAGSKRHSD